MTSPRAYQAAVDADVVDDVEDEVVKLFFSRCPKYFVRVVGADLF
jgi:hypothetical protein